jgi:hypothetical protein
LVQARIDTALCYKASSAEYLQFKRH